MVDGLGRDHERPGDLGVGRALRTISSSTSVSRGVRPAGPARDAGARAARDPAHAVGAQPPAQVRGDAHGAELVEDRERLEPRLLVAGLRERVGARRRGSRARPRRRRAAPVARDAQRVRLGVVRVRRDAARPRARARTRARRAPTARRGRPPARRSPARPRRLRPESPSSHACSARAARGRGEPLQLLVATASRHASSSVAPASGSPRRACRRPSAISAGHRLTPRCSPSASEARASASAAAPVAAEQRQVRAHAEHVLHVAVELALAREGAARARVGATRGSSRRRDQRADARG